MFDIDNAVSRWSEWESMETTIRKVFDGMPDHLARCLAESRSKYIDKNGVRKQLESLKSHWPELRQKIQNQIIPFNDVREHRTTFRAIPYMRNRFTNIDLIHRAGLMDEAEAYLFGAGGYFEC